MPSYLLSWNVHKSEDKGFIKEVQQILKDVPDQAGVILCLQEVRSSTYELIKDLHSEKVSGHYSPSWRYSFSKRSTGLLTVGDSSFAAGDAQARQLLSPGREFGFVSPKVSVFTELISADGKKLQIINCHGLNFVTIQTYAKQLDQIFDALEGRDGAAIVCGDFNVWSDRRLDLLRKKAQQVGLNEAVNRAPGKSPALAWMRGLKGVGGYDPALHLDRIFTRGVEVLDCYSIESSTSSDHLPVVLRFNL
ncbi:MAG: endonuclease/exonuclease/phosphatase family protein [Verrucomicrobiota bacterium]